MRYLADKSVWARVANESVAALVSSFAVAGRLVTCGLVDLEILFSARSAADHKRTRWERRQLPTLALSEDIVERAISVQGLLAARGQHRAASLPDLLIAATAEHHGATVLHYDSDFDLIAAATGQPVEWVVPRGTIA